MPLTLSGTSGVLDNSGAFIQGTAVTLSSQTSVDFTGIPSWVKRITVMFSVIGVSGGNNPKVQIGTSSGVVTSGYNNGSSTISNSVGTTNYSDGFNFRAMTGGDRPNGTLVITSMGSNVWAANGTVFNGNAGSGAVTAGSISLGGTLDRVRITINGSDTFVTGTVNILYE